MKNMEKMNDVPNSIIELVAPILCRIQELNGFRKHLLAEYKVPESKLKIGSIKEVSLQFQSEQVIAALNKILDQLGKVYLRINETKDKYIENDHKDAALLDLPQDTTIECAWAVLDEIHGLWVEIEGIIEMHHFKMQLESSGLKQSDVKNAWNPKAYNTYEVALDLYQTALLFDYLKKAKLIFDHSNNTLGKIAEILTGHSEQNIRTKAFSNIQEIKEDIRSSRKTEVKNYNLTKLKNCLEDILRLIEADMKK